MRRAPWWAFVLDLALVVLFVLIGRRSHAEHNTIVGLLTTAWPFVSGLGIGWLAAAALRWQLPTLRAGWLIVGCTTVGGMLLRAVSGQGIAVSFFFVTAIMLMLFLLGWRRLLPMVRGLLPRRGAAPRRH